MQDFPPRGAARRQRVAGDGTSQDAAWFNPAELPYRFPFEEDTGQVLLGLSGGYGVGFRDDRHMVMVAGTRAGKTSTVLVPNLLRYRGPCVIIDPKGELARLTAERRVAFGPVFVLDPFKKVPRSLSGVSLAPPPSSTRSPPRKGFPSQGRPTTLKNRPLHHHPTRPLALPLPLCLPPGHRHWQAPPPRTPPA